MRERLPHEGHKGHLSPAGLPSLLRVRRIIGESKLLLISDSPLGIGAALASVIENRTLLRAYLRSKPAFLESLDPLDVEGPVPKVAAIAIRAAKAAGVGPMAAVPGALADLALEEMLKRDGFVNVVENGGEVAANSIAPLVIGLYEGSGSDSGIGFRFHPDEFPIGVATSSATIGHALSFGQADAVMVVADSAALADAAATAICNEVRGTSPREAIERGLEFSRSIGGLRFVNIFMGGHVGFRGHPPELVRIKGDLWKALESGLDDALGDIKAHMIQIERTLKSFLAIGTP
ncbi:MAG: UPF0280 family protein [Candidatus Bathyarchaeia archaeon]